IENDAVVALDTGDHTLWFNRIFQAKEQDIVMSGRWRTLGFALAAAIAARLTFMDRQVVAVAGDGGIMQTFMELKTAAEQQLPVIVLLINNGSYAMEKNRMQAGGLHTMGSSLDNPDFVQLAKALGATAYRARTEEELMEAMQLAVESKTRPVLIDIAVAAT